MMAEGHARAAEKQEKGSTNELKKSNEDEQQEDETKEEVKSIWARRRR